jgi:hypothetical protein
LHRGQVPTARDKCDMFPAGRQPSAEIPADTAGTEYQDIHDCWMLIFLN